MVLCGSAIHGAILPHYTTYFAESLPLKVSPTWVPPPVNLLQRELHVLVQALDSRHKVDSQPAHRVRSAAAMQ